MLGWAMDPLSAVPRLLPMEAQMGLSLHAGIGLYPTSLIYFGDGLG